MLHVGHLACLHSGIRFASVNDVADDSLRSGTSSITGPHVLPTEEDCFSALCHVLRRRPGAGKEIRFYHFNYRLLRYHRLRRWGWMAGGEPDQADPSGNDQASSVHTCNPPLDLAQGIRWAGIEAQQGPSRTITDRSGDQGDRPDHE